MEGKRRRRKRSKGFLVGERLNQTQTYLTAARTTLTEDINWKKSATTVGFAPRQKLIQSEGAAVRTQKDSFFVKQCTLHKSLREFDDDVMYEFRDLHNGIMRHRSRSSSEYSPLDTKQNKMVQSATWWPANRLQAFAKALRSSQESRLNGLNLKPETIGMEGLNPVAMYSKRKEGESIAEAMRRQSVATVEIAAQVSTSPESKDSVFADVKKRQSSSLKKGGQSVVASSASSQLPKSPKKSGSPSHQRSALLEIDTCNEMFQNINREPFREYKLSRSRTTGNLKEQTMLLLQRKKLYKQFLAFDVSASKRTGDAPGLLRATSEAACLPSPDEQCVKEPTNSPRTGTIHLFLGPPGNK